jgi:hypothetical protein
MPCSLLHVLQAVWRCSKISVLSGRWCALLLCLRLFLLWCVLVVFEGVAGCTVQNEEAYRWP